MCLHWTFGSRILSVCVQAAPQPRAAVWAVKVRHLVAKSFISASSALILVNLEVLY